MRLSSGRGRIQAACSAISLFVLASPAGARPYLVDDLLCVEQFSQVLIDPSDRWAVIERQDPAGSAARFDYETQRALTLGHLLLVDLAHPEQLRPLLADNPAGLVELGFSPTGRRLAVARLRDRQWELGVVTMATRRVTWLGVTPQVLLAGSRILQWLSDDTLLAITYQPGDLPLPLREGWQTMAELPALWEQSATGQGSSATAVGSGRFRDVVAPARSVRLEQINVVSGDHDILIEGGITNFEAAPDRQHAAVIVTGEPVQPPAGARVGVGTADHRHRLVLIDLHTAGRSVTVKNIDVAGSLLRWSPNSTQLLFLGKSDSEAPETVTMLSTAPGLDHAVPLALGSIEPVIDGPPDFEPHVQLTWLGARPLLLARATTLRDAKPGWYSIDSETGRLPIPRGDDIIAADAHGAVMTTNDGLARLDARHRSVPLPATQGLIRVPIVYPETGIRAVSLASTNIAFSRSLSDDRREFALLGRHDPLTRFTLTGPARLRAASAQGRLAIIEQEDSQGVGTLLLLRAGRAPVPLALINQHLSQVTPSIPVAIHHRSAEGMPLTSWLYLPAPGIGHAPYPLIVIPYPGQVFGTSPPSYQRPSAGLVNISAQVLAGQGYAVLLPSLPSPASGPGATDLAHHLDEVLDQVTPRADIDSRRMALWGHSFGGYAAAMLATRTPRFRSIIASAGLYDLVSAYGTFLPNTRLHPEDGLGIDAMTGWSEQGQARLGGAPWQVPATYVANSPIFAADRIQAPVLLLQGDQDIASLTQAQELFSALYRQNKDAMLVSYWGEGHVVESPANLRDLYTRVFTWLDRTLRSPAPANSASSPR